MKHDISTIFHNLIFPLSKHQQCKTITLLISSVTMKCHPDTRYKITFKALLMISCPPNWNRLELIIIIFSINFFFFSTQGWCMRNRRRQETDPPIRSVMVIPTRNITTRWRRHRPVGVPSPKSWTSSGIGRTLCHQRTEGR